jgi:exosortase H (IPTLxxWG-CTERM-specific)
MTKFFLTFLLILITLFIAELTPIAQDHFVIPFTSSIAFISGWLMQLIDAQVQTQGKIIWNTATGFGVSIEAGCNGIEAGIVLIAAILAFPAMWKQKLIGIIIGMITIQGLNLLRIITLFYIGQWNKTVFEWAHLYIWQALIMLDVLFVTLLWLNWVSNHNIIHK